MAATSCNTVVQSVQLAGHCTVSSKERALVCTFAPRNFVNVKFAKCAIQQKAHDGRKHRISRIIVFAVDAEVLTEEIESDALERMDKTLESVKGNFATVRTGRATPSLLDRVEVEYYGTNVTLKSIAQVATPDSSTLLITPFDKSSIGSIEKALQKSDLGLTPSNDGNAIRLNVPQLTADRRKELLKVVSKLSEDGKVAVRNVRRDAMKQVDKLKKDKSISEDAAEGLSDTIQKLTDDYVKQIDASFKQKEKELLTV